MDDSILALLASSSDDENNEGPTYRELPPHQVWSETALVDAWSAALGEFAVRIPPSLLPTLEYPQKHILFVCHCHDRAPLYLSLPDYPSSLLIENASF